MHHEDIGPAAMIILTARDGYLRVGVHLAGAESAYLVKFLANVLSL